MGIVLECGSKLNREDQFGKLITRFVPDQRVSYRVSIIRFRSGFSSGWASSHVAERQTE